MKRKNVARYCQNDFDSDEYEDNDDEHFEKKIKKKAKKVNFNTIRRKGCNVKIVLMKVISQKNVNY